MCEQGKFPLHLRPSLGQMSKQFHAGAVKPEPGFCGSGFGFFQSVRCPIRWTKVTDALGTRLGSTVIYNHKPIIMHMPTEVKCCSLQERRSCTHLSDSIPRCRNERLILLKQKDF